MSWFDEQIRERKKNDSAMVEDSFAKIAESVLGKKMAWALQDSATIAKDAMENVLKYYHIKPGSVPDNIKSIEEQLEYQLRPHGMMTRNVHLEEGWEKDAYGAMLGKRKDNGEIVALIPGKFSGYSFYDAKTKKNVSVSKKNEGLFEDEALAFYIPFPLEKMTMVSLLRYIWGMLSGADTAVFIGGALAVTFIGFLSPLLSKSLFSDVLISGSMQALSAITVFMACVTVSGVLIGIVKSMALARISTKLHLSVEAAVMMRILSLPASFFKKYSAGELHSRSAHISELCDMLVDAVLSVGLTGLFSLAYIGQIFAFTPALAAPALAIILLSLLISAAGALWRMQISRQRMEQASKESGISYAMITGVQKIKLSGAEKRAFAQWGRQYAKLSDLAYNPPVFLKVNSVLAQAVSLVGAAALYLIAVKSHVSVSDFYAFNTAYGMVSGAFASLTNVVLTIADIKPILEICRPLMEAEPEVAQKKQMVERLSGGIELNGVTFRYTEHMPPVLDDLSLKIRPGQYVAICGSTGCGKSTLMRIMLGFEKPQRGAVYYDGRDLETLDLKSLRKKIGTVMQNGKLFQGDIFANITISAPQLTMDAAWEAAEMAGVAQDIRDMPMGMFTLVSEGQGGISGGQRQRLMIARAIAPKPKVLMFDEATSALDNLTQKKVSESLDGLKCTRVVIAHRLSTIRQCDRIIVLDKGRIVEDGTYEELIEQKGFFAELVARQQLEAAT